MSKILFDQGIPYSATRLMKKAGWEVVHVSDIRMNRATDQAILDYARTSSCICVTLDADFHTLLAVNHYSQPSVIRIRREGLNGAMLAQLLCDIWPKIEKVVEDGAMITVTEKALRIRRLPVLKAQ